MTDGQPSPRIPAPDRLDGRDWLLSALVPMYGSLAGLVALGSGQRRRPTTMMLLSSVNILVIVLTCHWLWGPGRW